MRPRWCYCGAELQQIQRIPAPISRSLAEPEPEAWRPDEYRASWLPAPPEVEPAIGPGWLCPEAWLIHGPRGSGKSRSVLRWLTHGEGRGLLVSLEMSGPVLARTVETCACDPRRLAVIYQWPEDWGSVAYQRVAIDSLAAAPGDPGNRMRELQAWAQSSDRVVWAIQHEIRTGGARGGTGPEHWADAEGRLTRDDGGNAVFSVLKRRAWVCGEARGLPLGTIVG